ncbi:MAG: PIG-L deacetylase family protein, partial [Candidatus Thorarchaeota archaeon]
MNKSLEWANEILEIEKTLILGYTNTGFINGSDLREKLIYYVRKINVDRVIAFYPLMLHEVHPDHLIVGRMAAEAGIFTIFLLLHINHIKEGSNPYSCSEIWFMGLLGHSLNCFVHISTTFEKKLKQL